MTDLLKGGGPSQAAAANPSAVAVSPDGDWFLYAPQNAGTIYVSGDMGLNWVAKAGSGTKATKAACMSTNAAHMFVVTDDGATGEIQRSVDQGANWSVVGNAARYTSICCSNDGRYVFATTQAGIEVSSDYGATFSPVTTPYRGVSSFDANSSDDAIQCSSANYADARSGAGTKSLMGETSTDRVGQRLSSGTYYCWEAFAYWDTSSLSDALVIADAYIDLRGSSDASTTAFDLEVRARDYGGSVQTSDYVAGADLSGLTLLATISSELVDTTYYVRSHPESALKSAINLTGNTQVLIHSSRQRTNDAPSGDEYWSLYGGTSGAKLRLRVEYLTTGAFFQVACSSDGRYVYAKQAGGAPNGEYVAVSSDYGVTWSHVNPDQANGRDSSLVVTATAGTTGVCCSADGQTVIVAPGSWTNNYRTRRSTDGGATWANAGLLTGGNYASSITMACDADAELIAGTGYWGGGVGGYSVSTDGGDNYQSEGSAFAYTGTGIAMSDDGLSICGAPHTATNTKPNTQVRRHSLTALKTVWACGNAGKIYRSTNGGHTWAAQSSGVVTDLRGIDAYDKDNALCCGDDGVILYTHDGGATWTASVDSDITGTGNDWRDVFMATPLVGWAVSYASKIVKTTDGGVTWTVQQADQSSKWLMAVDGNRDNVNTVLAGGPGWGGSGTKQVLRTTDGGTNWVQVPAGIGSGYGLGHVDVSGVYAVTCAQSSTSATGYSSDSGASFASAGRGGSTNGSYRGITIAHKGDGWDGRHSCHKGLFWGMAWQTATQFAGQGGTAGTANLQYAGYFSLLSVSGATFYHSHQGGWGWEASVTVDAGITLNDVWGEEEWFEWGEDLSIVIDDGATSTDDNDVHLDIHASASAQGANVPISQMCFSTDGATWSDWESYATTRAYQLPPQSDENAHTITVYVKFRATSEGTTYTSDPVSDTITLQIDWTDLSVYLEVVTLNDGMPVAGVTEVPLTFGGTSSAGDVVQYCYAIDGGAAVAWGTYVPDLSRPYHPMSITVELGTTGEHYVDVYLKDDDDNTLLIGRDDVLITDKTTIDYTRPFGVIPVRMYADSSQVRKMSHDIEAPNLLPVRIPTSAKRRR